MNIMKLICVMFMCAMVMGCLSQQAHERAIEELEMTQQNSAQEVERLHHVVQEKDEAVTELQKETQELEESLGSHEMKVHALQQEKQAIEKALRAQDEIVVQLHEDKKSLEAAVEVERQNKGEKIGAIKQELQALYSQLADLGVIQGDDSSGYSINLEDDNVDFDNLAEAFGNLRSTLVSQITDFSKLRSQNEQLEEEMQKLEARLRHVERLKKELEQVRADREAQEAKLAKVKREVQTVGKEIDRITRALEEKFGKSLVVTQHQDRLVLTMLGQILFESGKSQLTPLGLDIMKQVGEVLATLPNKNIQVEGHTDNNPIYGRLQQQYPTNWELSTARATTVLRYLIEQTGMNPRDFAATGYADTRPAVANDTEENQAQNRRVEIVLYPEKVRPETSTVATLAP